MNRYVTITISLIVVVFACKQKDVEVSAKGNSLLWKISGNGLEQPSYLYGTVHVLCEEDAGLSENFKKIIRSSDEVYFEIDMDDIGAMLKALGQMKMKKDTTLEELLNKSDFEKVKAYLDENDYDIPFSELKQYLPILTISIFFDEILTCKETTGVEEVILEVAEKSKKIISGLESLEYQLSVLDSIPYTEQAKCLVEFIDNSIVNKSRMMRQVEEMYESYYQQDLNMVDKLTFEADPSMAKFADILLYNRNNNWISKLKEILPGQSLVIAVGAGHLPGEKGMINLLRKEGYEVTALENKLPGRKK